MRLNRNSKFYLALLCLLFSACSSDAPRQQPAPADTPAAPSESAPSMPVSQTLPPPVWPQTPVPAYQAQGHVSAYQPSQHGQLSANGMPFDYYGLSAAHASLPLGAYVEVRNLNTQSSIVLPITDRLPASEALLRLSFSGLRLLGLDKAPNTLVSVRTLINTSTSSLLSSSATPPSTSGGQAYVQLAALSTQEQAQALQARLRQQWPWPVRIQASNNLYKIQLGPLSAAQNLRQIQQTAIDYGFHDAFIITQ